MTSTLRIVTVGFGLWAAAGSAAAQQPSAACPPDARTCGPTARGVNAWMQKHHDKKFYHPTICPGSCFGYFQTNWTAWEQACPNWCGDQAPVAGPAVVTTPAPAVQVPVAPASAPKTLPPTAPAKEPVKESSQLPPANAPTPAATTPVSIPGNAPGLTLPPVPDLLIGLPPTPPAANPSKS
jgi:hypothetical protein